MTKNRFEGEEDSDYIRDNKTDERALYLRDWLNKLNNLSDENEQLKKDIEFSDRKQNEFFKKWNDSINENFRLKQENEQLKEKNKQLRHDLNVLRRGVFGD